jgi:drug/metabolite transporter (DMT)-like permease
VLVLSWGLNFAIVKSVFPVIPPLAFNALRFLLSTGLLLLVLRVLEGSLRVARADLPMLILLGLIGHVGYQSFFIAGLARTSVAHSSLILAASPLFTGAFAVALRTERSSWRMWAGLVIGFAGLAVLIQGRQAASGVATVLGDLLTMGASACWALYTVLGRPYLDRLSPLRLTTVTLALSAPILVLAGVPDLRRMTWGPVGLQSWGALAFSAVFAITLCYVIWYTSVQAVGSTRTAVVTNLVPVVALGSGWLLLGETLTWLQGAGAVIVLLGVWLARLPAGTASGAEI